VSFILHSFVSTDPHVSLNLSRSRYLVSDDYTQTPLIDLSPCKGLEEVGLSLLHLRQPDHWIEEILQTVTSNRVRKITLNADFPFFVSNVNPRIDIHSWYGLDAMFLTMANRLDGTGEKLEVVFKALAPNVVGEFNPGWFLERCRTKVIVSFGCI
jgi:hypothetical protein